MLKNSNLVSFRDEAESAILMNDLALDLPTLRKFKDDGQMIAPATIACTGIMEYRAKECGALFADRDPNSIVKIMTTKEQLFDEASIESYRSAPITIGHPAEDVNINNSKELRKGHLDSIPFADEDGIHLAGVIVLDDIESINAVETGSQQLSSGHTCKLVLADKDAEWDAEKTEIRANHIAIVNRGRAKTTTIADKEIEPDELKMYDQDFVDSIQAKLDSALELVETGKTALKDAEANFKDSINSLVKARVAFLSEAANLTDQDISGMEESEAKVLILKDHLGKDFSGKSSAYIDGRYEALLDADVDKNSIAKELAKHALNDEASQAKQVAENISARERSIARSQKINKE